jgi:hypothetical protein
MADRLAAWNAEAEIDCPALAAGTLALILQHVAMYSS